MTNIVRRTMGALSPMRDSFFGPFEEQFNQLFNEFFEGDGLLKVKSKVNFPKMDVYTKDGKYVVEVCVAAFKPEDLNVEFVQDMDAIRISGKSSTEEYKEADFHLKEMRRSSFERVLSLPPQIAEVGDPEATIKDGILRLSWELPPEVEKANEAPEVKKIEIKVE